MLGEGLPVNNPNDKKTLAWECHLCRCTMAFYVAFRGLGTFLMPFSLFFSSSVTIARCVRMSMEPNVMGDTGNGRLMRMPSIVAMISAVVLPTWTNPTLSSWLPS